LANITGLTAQAEVWRYIKPGQIQYDLDEESRFHGWTGWEIAAFMAEIAENGF
jgi:hypothetical protein